MTEGYKSIWVTRDAFGCLTPPLISHGWKLGANDQCLKTDPWIYATRIWTIKVIPWGFEHLHVWSHSYSQCSSTCTCINRSRCSFNSDSSNSTDSEVFSSSSTRRVQWEGLPCSSMEASPELGQYILESLAKGMSHNLTKPQKMAEWKFQPPSWRCCAAEKHSSQKEWLAHGNRTGNNSWERREGKESRGQGGQRWISQGVPATYIGCCFTDVPWYWID